MNRRRGPEKPYRKLLMIELLIIIILLLAILGISIWNDWRRRTIRQPESSRLPSKLQHGQPASNLFDEPLPPKLQREQPTSNLLNERLPLMEIGVASYYGAEFYGRLTASGELYNPNALTAAHRELPFGTTVRVTNLDNNKWAVVQINDRGPHKAERILDVSKKAAQTLGFSRTGVARVKIEVLE